ncbi:MAG: caspase family protein, partial [Verrucomicrobiaceae bacterium]
MSTTIKILFIHGIGFQEEDTRWQKAWEESARLAVQATNPNADVNAEFFNYDQMFKDNDAPNVAMVASVSQMLTSWLAGKVGGLFGRSRGVFDNVIHDWEARPGMVAEWAGDKDLRKELREKLEAEVNRVKPDVIAAHSLGSLLSYEWLRLDANGSTIKDTTFLTFGSQISNPALAPVFDGQILMPGVKQWINLWNKQDKVFVDSIRLNVDGFRQIPLDREYGHDGTGYLSDITTRSTAWNQITLTYAPPAALERDVKKGAESTKSPRSDKARIAKYVASRVAARSSKKKKALLIGINEYENPANNLEGCVNDVCEMSAVLQECGFGADDIRIVLNDRATTAGIKERMEWLLDGAREDDTRFLFYSGHGAQMPGYGGDDIPEDVDECLVPYDFGWTADTAVVDDWFFELYSNLPYTVHFGVMLDCCHSGGMARDGGARVRGLNPPDDIRHRAMRWDKDIQMWLPRDRFAETGTGRKALSEKDTTVRTTRGLGSGDIGRAEARTGVKHRGASKRPQNVDAAKPYGPFM